jgi:hypothetical protein
LGSFAEVPPHTTGGVFPVTISDWIIKGVSVILFLISLPPQKYLQDMDFFGVHLLAHAVDFL